jgi:alkyl sulfatase BDS1-like metallo-beta-lactamase superfamily hydrolase
VNPSLWRQERLNGIHGLFEVVPGVHQVRGYDISNLTLVDGETGWIVVDPLTARETAEAAMALARSHLGDRPVVAVIFTHSHLDHFGGIEGVLPQVPDERARVRIVAPASFVEEATSENVMAGIAMGRRASFMYGMPLDRSPRGHVGSGLGKQPARGSLGIAAPTDVVDHTPQEIVLDGVRFVFQHAPNTEAPAELTFYLPDRKAFCGAEVVSHTLHNLYTLRGAKVRDALVWSQTIDEAMRLFGEAEVVFASHHWPTWGRERVADHLAAQRDVYRYIHDQTLRLANQGATPREIAEEVELPASLAARFAVRGYYGTVRHNAKAVYQAYFGWYDGNPANLDPLPPVEEAARYVEAMGGADAVLARGQAALDAGDYRWAATLLDHLVFAAPGDERARALLAAVYDQLGYRRAGAAPRRAGQRPRPARRPRPPAAPAARSLLRCHGHPAERAARRRRGRDDQPGVHRRRRDLRAARRQRRPPPPPRRSRPGGGRDAAPDPRLPAAPVGRRRRPARNAAVRRARGRRQPRRAGVVLLAARPPGRGVPDRDAVTRRACPAPGHAGPGLRPRSTSPGSSAAWRRSGARRRSAP